MKICSEFVSLWDVSRVKFDHSSWTQASSFSGGNRARGIVSFDARYSVINGSTFTNLDRGIYAGGLDPMKSIAVNGENVFTSCQQSIYLKGGAFHYIGDNTFNLSIANQNDQNPEVSAVRLDGASNVVIENNNIIGGTPIASNDNAQYGILNENTGENSSFIFKNHFSNLFVGTQTQSNNGGLSIRCNDYTNHRYSWAINPLSSGTFSDQGDCGPGKNQAGNVFNDAACVNGQYSHIYSSLGFDYSYDPNQNNSIPQCRTNNVSALYCTETNTNSCSQRASITSNNVSQYTSALPYITDNFERGLLRTDIIRFKISQDDITSCRTLLSGETTDHWKRLRALTELYHGDTTTAQNVAASVSGSNDEKSDFDTLWPILYRVKSSNQTFRQLTQNEHQTLDTLSSNRTQSGYLAQSILESTYGESYTSYLETISNSGGSKYSSAVVTTPKVQGDNIIIRPNPVGNETTIILPENIIDQSFELIVIGALGNTEIKRVFDMGSNQVLLDTSHLSSGLHYIRLSGNKGKQFSSKFIK